MASWGETRNLLCMRFGLAHWSRLVVHSSMPACERLCGSLKYVGLTLSVRNLATEQALLLLPTFFEHLLLPSLLHRTPHSIKGAETSPRILEFIPHNISALRRPTDVMVYLLPM